MLESLSYMSSTTCHCIGDGVPVVTMSLVSSAVLYGLYHSLCSSSSRGIALCVGINLGCTWEEVSSVSSYSVILDISSIAALKKDIH